MSERCHGEHLTSPTRIHPRSSGHQPAKAGRLIGSYNSSSPTPEGAVYGGGEGAGGTEERSNEGIGEGDGRGGGGDVRSNAATKGKGGRGVGTWLSITGWSGSAGLPSSETPVDCICIPGHGRLEHPNAGRGGTPAKDGEEDGGSRNEAARAVTEGGEGDPARTGSASPPNTATLDEGICIPASGGQQPTDTGRETSRFISFLSTLQK